MTRFVTGLYEGNQEKDFLDISPSTKVVTLASMEFSGLRTINAVRLQSTNKPTDMFCHFVTASTNVLSYPCQFSRNRPTY